MTVEHEDNLRADLASLRIDRDAAPNPARTPPRHRRLLPIVFAVLVLAALAVWAMTGRAVPVTVVYATVSAPGQAGPAAVPSGVRYVVSGGRLVLIWGV